MIVQKAFKFRLYPDSDQQKALSIQFGHSRFVYNRYLDMRKTLFLDVGLSFNYYACANDLALLKQSEEFAWLQEADSQVLQQALTDLDKAFQNFFRNHREGALPKVGKKPRKDGMPKGYPNFHRKHDEQSIRYPQRVTLKENAVYLPKVGTVKAHFHCALVGKINSATVSKTKSGKYFVSLQCAMETPEPQDRSNDPAIGLDLGLKDFATLSTGEKMAPPKPLKGMKRRLAIRQRRVSRKLEAKKDNGLWVNRDKGDKSIKKAAKVVATTHEKIANRRKDFHHQLSRRLVNRFGLIALEAFNVKGMMQNGNLALSIADAGWSQLVNFLTYKQAWVGGEIIHVDRFYPSSKTCSACGAKHASLKLSDRRWICPGCGTIHDRDENAAVNILKQATVGTTESSTANCTNAVGHMSQPVGNSAPESIKTFE